ncbi:polysaccharide pyruvyl transferase family protein [Amycolatopsis balhimycina DSM 5908]|uniref:Polysaccharide pyruvyl transferase family protein n=1 Tax=Amycolatopsis balhimycina DSM 5908 TaxID=1081091 RepID=A0A428VVN3_AMYBA|nr:polysaccharide pyruvyl transferase family protein [Amycolatopsis balhimycina]RSM34886.1 polysaccharide pyruvyl transferase family protein [Amycolatopsis balhimycina DSM 5908]
MVVAHSETSTPKSAQRALYYVVAPVGHPNYGDELIAASWLRELAETAPDADVWVDTHSPGPAAVLLDGIHPRAKFTDTLWRLCWEAPSEDPWQAAAWVREAVHNPGMMPRLHGGIELLATADVVHVVGGGYINKLWPKQIGLFAGAAAAVERSGGRAAMTGHGLVPACDDVAPLLLSVLDHFEVVEVRDEASAALVDVQPGIDDAFLGIGPHRYETADDQPEVMLCLQSDLVEVGIGKLAGAVLSMLRAWKVPPERIGVVEGVPRVDREVFALLERELPGARFYPFSHIWAHGLPANPRQTWISTRFHVHMLAAAAGASGVAVSVNPDYYATKHRSLAALGSNWTVLEDLGQVPDRPTAGGYAPDVLERLRKAKVDVARTVYAPVERRQQPDATPEPRPESLRRRWSRRILG